MLLMALLKRDRIAAVDPQLPALKALDSPEIPMLESRTSSNEEQFRNQRLITIRFFALN